MKSDIFILCLGILLSKTSGRLYNLMENNENDILFRGDTQYVSRVSTFAIKPTKSMNDYQMC